MPGAHAQRGRSHVRSLRPRDGRQADERDHVRTVLHGDRRRRDRRRSGTRPAVLPAPRGRGRRGIEDARGVNVRPEILAIAVPALPAASFVLLAAFGRRLGGRAHWVALAAVFGSLACSVALLLHIAAGGEGAVIHATFPWAIVGGRPVEFGVFVDGLSASVLVMVAVVAAMVFTYAAGYMCGDERYGWFFSAFSLFLTSMFALVISSNLLQVMVFWEVMGLCSYLLIGFWYEREESRRACIKAFITTRIGDMGFLAGTALLWIRLGSLDLRELPRLVEEADPRFLALAALLLLMGAVGKSAQFPLHVWLPDAMAGPTPVSGLLHSATMVAAGVFLVARTYPVFEASHFALPFITGVGVV
ncbi:MAG: hypothetical protein FDZ70_00475 [Actinobacteria bacterium]|nr:MAG: hypothetical protein FDZ70_00475 [Actinomycetota bacterium]